MAIRDKVMASLGVLPAAEKKVAHAFLANYPSVGLSTIAELASIAGTSAPTVLRFVGRMGFASYPDFQRELRADVQVQLMSPLERGRSASPPVAENRALQPAFARLAANLEATLSAIPESEFEAAVDLLTDQKAACYCLGGRITDAIAAYLASHLRVLRPNVFRFGGQTSVWRDQLLDVRPGDVVVLFDIRRYQSDLVRLGELLVERKARILLITDPWLSPIARQARVVIPCAVNQERTWDSSVALMAVAEALIDRATRTMWQTAQPRMQTLEDIHWNAPRR